MGSFVLYILEWSLALLLFLLIWKLAFAGTTLHRFNRIYLLGATAVSAILPLFNVQFSQMLPISIEQTQFAFVLNEVTVSGSASKLDYRISASDHVLAWILVSMYAVYMLTLITGWIQSFIRMGNFLRGKKSHKVGRSVRLYQAPGEFGPFSWMNCIVISDSEEGFARKVSLRHELSHIRLGHYVDLMVLSICTIVNPVCWLVLKEMKIIHEYEADAEVINRYAINEKDYQRLLIMRTVGAEAYALASSFNLNIKQRIIMMKKEKTLRRRLLWMILVIPAMGISLVAFANEDSATKLGVNQISKSKTDDIEKLNVEQNIHEDEAFITYEKLPEFPGGMKELFSFLTKNMEYPKEAADSAISGRVIVQFVVDKDGSIIKPEVIQSVHPSLDAEALRIVSLMPKWSPGKQNGEPIKAKFTLPITFRLN